jgi:hypothetical protein
MSFNIPHTIKRRQAYDLHGMRHGMQVYPGRERIRADLNPHAPLSHRRQGW